MIENSSLVSWRVKTLSYKDYVLVVINIEHPKHLSQRSQSGWNYDTMSNKLAIPILKDFQALISC